MEKGDYGPYYQSKRKDIYHVFAKTLVEKDLAYPCFCSAEELDEIRAQQENEPQKGYWGKYAKCRNLTLAEIQEKISAGAPWTLRLKSPGDLTKKCFFEDMIKGKIEMPENVQDIVLLKSDGIPTYHFAHAVDDHLMRTPHVVRGDEWMSSCPVHLQLFKCLGFKVPKYAHVAPIMKEENGGKRKLSKRKDPEAAVSYFFEQGFPKESVLEYLLTLLNSNFEDWRRANPKDGIEKFPFNLKKMSSSGCLFDLVKLTDVSKNEYVQLASGVYMQIVDKGSENLADTIRPNEVVLVRFSEYSLYDKMVTVSNLETPYMVDEFRYTVTSSSIAGIFSTATVGAMYYYYGSTTVPAGWLAALAYIRDGAHVKLIVPHKMGHDRALSNVYPYFYDLRKIQFWR